jgi:hypothetical protein
MQILEQVLNQADASFVTALLFDLSHSAHAAQCRTASLFICHSFGEIILDLLIQMILEFVTQFLIRLAASKKRADSQRHGVEPMLELHV